MTDHGKKDRLPTAKTSSFENYFKSYDKYTLFALLPILLVTFLLDRIFALQPPWPTSSTYITSFFELAIIITSFFSHIKTKKDLRRRQIIFLTAAGILFFSYFTLYSLFVHDVPVGGRHIIAGCTCSQQATLFIGPSLGQDCPFLGEEALAAAGYQAEVVWTPFSIRIMEVAIFSIWSAFFMIITYLLAITIRFAGKTRLN